MDDKPIELSGSHANIARLASQSATVLEQLRNEVRNARADERREPIFPISRAAELVGRTPTAIRDAEKDGRLSAPDRTATNRKWATHLASSTKCAMYSERARVGRRAIPSRWSQSKAQGRRREIYRVGAPRAISGHKGLSGLPDRL